MQRLCKMVTLSQKLKMPKTCEKPFYRNNRAVLCKKTVEKKPQIFEKRHNFENQPFCKGYSPYKGYNLCKMLSLGQKKNTKKMRKTITKYSRIKTFLKIGHLAKLYPSARAIPRM